MKRIYLQKRPDFQKQLVVHLPAHRKTSSSKPSSLSSLKQLNILTETCLNYNDKSDLAMFKEATLFGLPVKFLEDILKVIDTLNINSSDWGINSFDSSQKVFEMIVQNLDKLKGVNKRGYVNDTDLMKIPLIGDIIPFLITHSEKNSQDLRNSNGKDISIKNKKNKNINKVLIDGNEYSFTTARDLYKWSYNLINLKMYLITETVLKGLKNELVHQSEGIDSEFNRNLNDLILDYVNLSKSLLNNLDPGLRKLFNKRGIGITQNIYTGFDTEYVNKTSTENDLLSVQLAVGNKTLLKLPLDRSFEFGELNVDSNKFYKSRIPLENRCWTINNDIIKSIIDNSVGYIRHMKYSNYDSVFEVLIKGLRSKGLREVVKDDSIYFIFEDNFMNIKEWFKVTNNISFKDLVGISWSLSEKSLANELAHIYDLLKTIYEDRLKISGFGDMATKDNNNNNNNNNNIDNLNIFKESLGDIKRDEVSNPDLRNFGGLNKKYVRSHNQSISQENISTTKKVNNYFIGHLTSADLSMLSDFDEIKHNIDIVNKSFVTITKPILINGINVIIRDTMLLAPGGKKSLDAIGKMYNTPKTIIPDYYKDKMDELLRDDKDLFKEYAMQDAVITLVHAGFMEIFFNEIGGIGVPLTLSGLSGNYIKYFWNKTDYPGYQVSHEYLLTDVSKTNTPKGLSVVKDIGLMNNYFIASYRGGRNESFMYGKEISDCVWFDYDLVSAYTTAMAGLGSPDYKNAKMLSVNEYKELVWKDQVFSYTILKVKFKFPGSVKYPSIACNIDESTTVYPLEGESIINSLEYIVAIKQGCEIQISEIVHIPFKKVKEGQKEFVEKPFRDCIAELQGLRSKYEKGSINNLLYKEIGNSLYGLTVRGISNKLKFDARSCSMKRMEGNDLSNPIIASWITSFIRAVVSECLHSIHLLGGRIVSVTTDGFITDISDLENKILKLKGRDKSLMVEYKNLRKDLLNDETGLEVKKSGKGIVSWCTRGQISTDSGIVAMTGFQRGNLSLSNVEENISFIMDSDDKSFNFLKTQLRSAKDIFLKGGQVTQVFSDQIYRVMYDNKRIIIDSGEDLLDSRPLNKIEEGMLVRYISKLPKTVLYSRNIQSVSARYKNREELIIRNFLKALLNNELNLDRDSFKNYRDILDFIKEYDPSYSISENYIAQLKRRGNFVKVPKTKYGSLFVDYVCVRFPNFIKDGLFIK